MSYTNLFEAVEIERRIGHFAKMQKRLFYSIGIVKHWKHLGTNWSLQETPTRNTRIHTFVMFIHCLCNQLSPLLH